MGDHTKGTGGSEYKSSSVNVGGKTVTIKNQLDKYAGKEKQLAKAKTGALATDETISACIDLNVMISKTERLPPIQFGMSNAVQSAP